MNKYVIKRGRSYTDKNGVTYLAGESFPADHPEFERANSVLRADFSEEAPRSTVSFEADAKLSGSLGESARVTFEADGADEDEGK